MHAGVQEGHANADVHRLRCGQVLVLCQAPDVRFLLRARCAVADSEAWMMQVLQRAATVDGVVWPNCGGGRWHSAQGHLPTPEAMARLHLPGWQRGADIPLGENAGEDG